jgi:hypothetical protein
VWKVYSEYGIWDTSVDTGLRVMIRFCMLCTAEDVGYRATVMILFWMWDVPAIMILL